jgi:hypothetical protein
MTPSIQGSILHWQADWSRFRVEAWATNPLFSEQCNAYRFDFNQRLDSNNTNIYIVADLNLLDAFGLCQVLVRTFLSADIRDIRNVPSLDRLRRF